jgi:hypothetical protein
MYIFLDRIVFLLDNLGAIASPKQKQSWDVEE